MDRVRCRRRVYDGRMIGGYQCSNWAKEGDPDGLCGTHRAQEERRKRPPAEPAPAEREPNEVRVGVVVSATAEWETGTGPVFPVSKWDSSPVRWRTITVRCTPGEWPPRVTGGYGDRLKKDGSVSANSATMAHHDWDTLPEDVRRTIRAHLDPMLARLSDL